MKERIKIMRKKFLKLFQNVVSRWNFICHMLMRILQLKIDLKKFFFAHNEATYLKLSINEWNHVKVLINIIKSFCVFTKVLNRTKTFTLQYIFKIYNHVFNALNDVQIVLVRKTRTLWTQELNAVIDATRNKLQYYYNKIQKEISFLFDKIHLFTFIYDDKLFREAKWKDSNKFISWRNTYWNALKNDYFKYKTKYNDETFKSS